MGMTLTEKIFARASEKAKVSPGEIVNAKIDYAMIPDGVCSLLNDGFRELGTPVWDTEKAVIVIDHASPPCIVGHTKWVMDTIKFVDDFNIKNFYNMQGVAHQIMPEDGFVTPGALIVGADSHTVTYGALGAFSTGLGATEMTWVLATGELWFKVPETIRVEVSGKLNPRIMGKDIILKVLELIGVNGATYKTLEFGGEAIRDLSVDGRLTMCNMAVEAGAKNGIVETDKKTLAYLKGRTSAPVSDEWVSDRDCKYLKVIEIDARELEPLVSLPHNPGNVVPIGKIEGKKVDQVLLGSCTGGRMEDYRIAAEIMKGKKVPRHLRVLVIPASARVAKDMLKEGLTELFMDCGCIVSSTQCGPCGGMQMGFIGPGEACLGTHNRNFRGRMGSPDGEIYLASPATAAATALTGLISDPRKA
jgi:homoaconitate hydratase family protein